jgi:hypothetical protein
MYVSRERSMPPGVQWLVRAVKRTKPGVHEGDVSDIFISYAREDADFVGRFAKLLAESGWSVWSDQYLSAGDAFASTIQSELATTRCLIAVWTRHSVESAWVSAEALEAVRLRKRVFSVRTDASVIPPLPFNAIHSPLLPLDIARKSAPVSKFLADLRKHLAAAVPDVRVIRPPEPARQDVVPGRRVDSRKDVDDHRDQWHATQTISLPQQWPDTSTLKRLLPRFAPMVIDQGREGGSSAYALANLINYFRFRVSLGQGAHESTPPAASALMLLHFGRIKEGPSSDVEGVSCRSVLKGWEEHGVCSDVQWGQTVKAGVKGIGSGGWMADARRHPLDVYLRIRETQLSHIQASLLEVGLLLAAIRIRRPWGRIRSDEKTLLPIPSTTSIRHGVHAVVVVGYTDEGFVILNSWGRAWGCFGCAIVPYIDWLNDALDVWMVLPGVARNLEGGNLRGLKLR